LEATKYSKRTHVEARGHGAGPSERGGRAGKYDQSKLTSSYARPARTSIEKTGIDQEICCGLDVCAASDSLPIRAISVVLHEPDAPLLGRLRRCHELTDGVEDAGDGLVVGGELLLEP